VDAVSITAERTLVSARKLERFVALLLGLAGVGIFVYGILSASPKEVVDPLFYTEPNIFLSALALGLLAFLYVLYRGKRDHEPPKTLPAERIEEALDEFGLKTVEDAFLLSERAGGGEVTATHLFSSALGTVPGRIFLARLGVSFEFLKLPLRRKLDASPKGEPLFGETAERIMESAYAGALQNGRKHIGALEIFAAAYVSDDFFAELLEEQGITREELENALAWMRISEDLQERYENFRKAASFKPTSNMNRSMTAVATPFLDAVSEDLTRDAVFGRTALLVGREKEVEAIFRAIEGGNSSVVLVGQSGVGRGAIVEGIADLMVEENVPAVLKDKRLLKLSVPHIVSAEGGRGAEERFLHALGEVGHTGNVVLVIEDIHELVGTGNTGVDLSSILASELEKGYTFVIATTTPEGYKNAVERSVLGPKLSKVVIEEPARDQAIRILEAKIANIEVKNKVAFTYGALAACVDLSARYMHDSVLPQKAIELAKEVGLTVSKRSGGRMGWIKKEDVASLVGMKTNIPVTEVTEDEGEKLLKLEEHLHERVIGQEHAVSAVSSALRRARAAMRSEGKPIANFLFLGPTGVGKTELAKATAAVYFGSENAMIRFDMSEYGNKESVSRLIGGNGETGLLTEAVRKNPFALLLLDEVEKAHPDILNLFLQVMDDGRLTDGTGRTIDFTNVILIATSNAGTQYIQDEVKNGTSLIAIKDALMNTELRQLFRPEFLNRFNDVIVFAPLTQADVTAIAYLLIAKVAKRMEEKFVTLEVTDSAVHELAVQGFDPKFGARPLRRVIEERLENLLADEFLKGNFGRRDTVIFDAGGKLEVRKAQKL
jgi:ATP-dependent Clp protease ATP-binding subunit ClpC